MKLSTLLFLVLFTTTLLAQSKNVVPDSASTKVIDEDNCNLVHIYKDLKGKLILILPRGECNYDTIAIEYAAINLLPGLVCPHQFRQGDNIICSDAPCPDKTDCSTCLFNCSICQKTVSVARSKLATYQRKSRR